MASYATSAMERGKSVAENVIAPPGTIQGIARRSNLPARTAGSSSMSWRYSATAARRLVEGPKDVSPRGAGPCEILWRLLAGRWKEDLHVRP